MDNKNGNPRVTNRRKFSSGQSFSERTRGTDNYRDEINPEPFTCALCGRTVSPEGAGGQHRNHCPYCLSSVHLDVEQGDRAASCGQIMDPIGVWVKKNGEWALIHRCRECGALNQNRIAADDNPLLLMSIAVRPLASPPFPLGRLDIAGDAAAD